MLKRRIQDNLETISRALELRRARAARAEELKKPKKQEEHLSEAQRQVALLRLDIGDRWPQPDVMDSYVFLVSEIGEVGDALIRTSHGRRGDYVRNNPKQADLNAELGDAYLMLCTLATCLDLDLDAALQDCIDKLREKYDEST